MYHQLIGNRVPEYITKFKVALNPQNVSGPASLDNVVSPYDPACPERIAYNVALIVDSRFTVQQHQASAASGFLNL